MSIRAAIPVISVLLIAACGGGASPAESPPPEPTGQPVTEAPPAETAGETSEEGSKQEAPKEEPEPAMAPRLDKPASEATIAGTSISSIDGVGLQEAVTKLGWTKETHTGPAAGAKAGSYETLTYEIGKGKLSGTIEITRPAMIPGDVASIQPLAEQKDAKEKEGAAVYYDEAADVLVVVKMTEGKPADAKGILGKLVKKAPAKKK